MKNFSIFSIGLLLFSSYLVQSQDTLVTVNHSKILVRIIEERIDDVKYSNILDPNSPEFTISKSELESIIFSDGYVKKMNISDMSERETGQDLFLSGQNDALHYYKGYRAASTGTLIVGLLSPIVGLIPAIACSATAPKESNLQYPSTELFHKIDYKRGYSIQAKRIKSKKVWTNWGIAFGVNVALVLILPK